MSRVRGGRLRPSGSALTPSRFTGMIEIMTPIGADIASGGEAAMAMAQTLVQQDSPAAAWSLDAPSWAAA